MTQRRQGGLLQDGLKVLDGRVHTPVDEIAKTANDLRYGHWAELDTPEEKDFLELCGGWREPRERRESADMKTADASQQMLMS